MGEVEGPVRSGFNSYLSSGKFTPDFIDDVDTMISKVFSRWRLYETEDEFRAFCWTKIVGSLKIYDEQGGRETGPLSTYLYQVIMNEARRIHSKYSKFSSDNASELVEQVDTVSHGDVSGSDLDLRDRLCSFARRAFGMGVYVDQYVLCRNYYAGTDSPGVKAFKWANILGL
jgi:hypothetical protein